MTRLVDLDSVLEVVEARLKTFEGAEAGARHPDTRAEVRRLVSEFSLLRDALSSLPSQEGEVEELRQAKDGAYEERNHLVAALAQLFDSGVKRTEIPGWDPEWHGCCYINLPSGQISYHFHDSQAHLFEGLPPYGGEWDGHDKETVHRRLLSLLYAMPASARTTLKETSGER